MRLSLTGLLVLCGAAQAFEDRACKPLPEADIITLLRAEVVPAAIERGLKKCGLGFELTADARSRLKAAGVADTTLDVARELDARRRKGLAAAEKKEAAKAQPEPPKPQPADEPAANAKKGTQRKGILGRIFGGAEQKPAVKEPAPKEPEKKQ